MKPVVQIRNVEDLKRALLLQKIISRKAKDEFTQLGEVNRSLKQAQEATLERDLLAKWVNEPTLSEFQLIPHSIDANRWGSTFGVTVLLNELVMSQVSKLRPEFDGNLRYLLFLLLEEMESPKHQFLVEPLLKVIHFKISADGKELEGEQRAKVISELVTRLVEAFLTVLEFYDCAQELENGCVLTPLGQRVLLHLVDARFFVDEMMKAHKKFQSAVPQLSMV